MAETYTGQVQDDGVIVFEGTVPALAAGTRVRIELIEAEDESTPTLAERLKPIIGEARGLPPDLKVDVEPVEIDMEAAVKDLSRRLLSLAGICKGLPSDLAEQHDHYIHGTPKR